MNSKTTLEEAEDLSPLACCVVGGDFLKHCGIISEVAGLTDETSMALGGPPVMMRSGAGSLTGSLGWKY